MGTYGSSQLGEFVTRLELHDRTRAVRAAAHQLQADLQEHRAAGCAVECCLDAFAQEELADFLEEVEALTLEVTGT